MATANPSTNPPPPAAPSDPTFRSYNTTQAQAYATQRLSYSSALYATVLTHHESTGGAFDFLLDVGCGPGNATRDVARSFDRALGVDPGEAMIAAARERGGRTRSGEEVRFEVGPAEAVSAVEGVPAGEGVDLVIAAMAVG